MLERVALWTGALAAAAGLVACGSSSSPATNRNSGSTSASTTAAAPPKTILTGHEPGTKLYSQTLAHVPSGGLPGWDTKNRTDMQQGFDKSGYAFTAKRKGETWSVTFPVRHSVPAAYIQTQLSIFGDGIVGLFCGNNASPVAFYEFLLSSSGKAGIFRVGGGRGYTVWPYHPIPKLDTAKSNTMAAYCNGTTVAMYVNGDLVHSAQVPTPPQGGEVGYVVETFGTSTQVTGEFHNVFVSRL